MSIVKGGIPFGDHIRSIVYFIKNFVCFIKSSEGTTIFKLGRSGEFCLKICSATKAFDIDSGWSMLEQHRSLGARRYRITSRKKANIT